MKPTPFKIAVPQQILDRIHAKLDESRIGYAPDDDANWKYGTDATYLAELVDYWRNDYDWRAEEERLNRWPQFLAKVDDIDIHFYHIRADKSRSLPILLTHGWPGSVVEFQDMASILVAAGYDVVIASLPGFGWSGRPARPIGPRKVARLWRDLMVDILGYPRFIAQGGDFGSAVTFQLGADHADHVAGIHLNFFMGPQPGPDADEELLSYWGEVAKLMEAESGYHHEHATKPQTIGLALHDNPVGWAAWVIEKFQGWGDTGGDIESRFSKDHLITNLMTYLVTDSVMSSIWMYYGTTHEELASGPISVPTALARFPGEFYPMPSRTIAARQHNLVRYTEMESGGHFAAMEEPEALAADLLAFCDMIIDG